MCLFKALTSFQGLSWLLEGIWRRISLLLTLIYNVIPNTPYKFSCSRNSSKFWNYKAHKHRPKSSEYKVNVSRLILCFVDREASYNLITWCTIFRGMFISYVFRATMCPSSGELTLSMRHFVFVTLCRWLSGMQGGMKLVSFHPAYQTFSQKSCSHQCD
jgi:hypothetical protein